MAISVRSTGLLHLSSGGSGHHSAEIIGGLGTRSYIIELKGKGCDAESRKQSQDLPH
jgi:hypothetical protein